MSDFIIHTIESAPEESRPILEKFMGMLGFVPNLFGVMAEAPAMLEAYTTLSGILDKSSLDTIERQVVLLTASRLNGCEYCVGAHSALAGFLGVPEDVVGAVRAGEPIAKPRLQALAAFTESLVANRGWAPEADVAAFLGAGWSRREALEVILGVGMKTLSNYVNHIAKTPLDDQFAAHAWERPAG